MPQLRVLVTGGAGFIGAALTRRLVEEGHSVVIFDSLIPQVHGHDASIRSSDFETIRADVRDSYAVGRAMAGVDVVHHLAAETGVAQSETEIARYVGTNTLGTAVILEAAVAARVGQVILASSRAIYGEGPYQCAECGDRFAAGARRLTDLDRGMWDVSCPRCGSVAQPLPAKESDTPDPISTYGVTKLQQEHLLRSVARANGLPVTILRLFNVFGPGQSLSNPHVGVLGSFFRRAISGLPAELYEDGEIHRDFIFIDDAVEALRLATGNETVLGLNINVGSGLPTPLRDVVTGIFERLSLEPLINVSGHYRLGDVRYALADISHMEEALGFRPATMMSDGLDAYVAWAREKNNARMGVRLTVGDLQ